MKHTDPGYRLWISEDHCQLVRLWADGTVEVAVRDDPGSTWGPPATLKEETA